MHDVWILNMINEYVIIMSDWWLRECKSFFLNDYNFQGIKDTPPPFLWFDVCKH